LNNLDKVKTTVAIYIRCSTNEKRQTTENQLRDLSEYCKRKGWDVFRVYEDYGSAYNQSNNRTQFEEMFSDAMAARFHAVVVWSLDRFSREGVEKCLAYIRRLDSFGVGIISYKEEFISTMGPMKEFFLSIFASLAKLESMRSSERIRAGVERARKNGEKLGRPKQKKIFREDIVKQYLASGNSISQTARMAGVSFSTVQRIKRRFKNEISN
jgi:DNA invertase Pin-like site-specific DNA recombinase